MYFKIEGSGRVISLAKNYFQQIHHLFIVLKQKNNVKNNNIQQNEVWNFDVLTYLTELRMIL